MRPLRDAKGCEIQPGDVLKVLHFIGARRKRNYMYKQALAYEPHKSGDGGYLKISHLTLGIPERIGDTWYFERADGRVLGDYEIVQQNSTR